MRQIWLTSDTHFQHKNIIEYGERPFSSVDEMDETLVQNWNDSVKPGDIVYHLGDVYMTGKDRIGGLLGKLHGRKRLILGNHDDLKDKVLLRHFQKVLMWRMLPEFGLLLTHVPVHSSTLDENPKRKAMTNVHGHIHQKDSPLGPYVNVSVEKTGYRPVNIEELRVR